MKTNIRSRLAILIALVACLFLLGTGWRDRSRLAAARSQQQQLLAEARSLGIEAESASKSTRNDARAAHRSSRPRIDSAASRDLRLRDFADRIAGTLAELEAISRDGHPADAEFQKRLHGVLNELQGMSAADLQQLCGIFSSHSQITEKDRGNVIFFVARTLAAKHPQAALDMALDLTSPLAEDNHRRDVVGTALGQWAADDPLAALRWFHDHPEAAAHDPGDVQRLGLIIGAARQDPSLAFQLISEIGIRELSDAGNAIAYHATDPSDRDRVLAALRSHLASSADAESADTLRAAVVSRLVAQAARDGAASAIRWIENAALDPAEFATIPGSAGSLAHRGERAVWLDWFASRGDPVGVGLAVSQILGPWTVEDPQAAEAWTHHQPAGPARDTALAVLAETIAPHDPVRAIQHAAKLPPGLPRERQIGMALDHWRERDPDAAAAFARQHSVEQ